MDKRFSSVVGVVAMALALAPTAVKADIIDFDAIAATCCYGDVTPGGPRGPVLSFPILDLDGGVVMDNSGWGGLATTAPNVYGTSDFLPLADASLLPGEITGTINPARIVNMIDLDVINGFIASDFTLTAYDAASAVVDSEVISLDAFGSGPGAVGHVSVSGAGIASFKVTSAQGAGSIDFAVDTIVAVPEPGVTAMLSGMGIGLVSFVIRRRRQA